MYCPWAYENSARLPNVLLGLPPCAWTNKDYIATSTTLLLSTPEFIKLLNLKKSVDNWKESGGWVGICMFDYIDFVGELKISYGEYTGRAEYIW